MGMFRDMAGKEKPAYIPKEGDLLATGTYKSGVEQTLAGYKIYQKRYIVKRVALQMLLVLLAIISSVIMLMSSENGTFSMMILIMAVFSGFYFINEPMGNKKKLKQSLEMLKDIEYKAEIYTDRVKISTVYIPPELIEESEPPDETLDGETEEVDNSPPATIIHLDLHIVDVIEAKEMFVIVVGKKSVFVIPKTAFNENDIETVRDKLTAFIGFRYKQMAK